ncbi:hypothetical protein Tco_0643733 [Tanacetum coccineum]
MSGTVPPIPPPLGTSSGNTGGSHVTNLPVFDKEDFTSWKVRFLVFLDGLEPYLLKILKDGPFVPMSSLSTSDNSFAQTSKSMCKTTKEMWNDLIVAHEGPSDTRDTKIVALRLKFNAFKSLEGEKVNGTFTRLKFLLNDLENNNDSDSDVKEDQRSIKEFMANLNVEYHERALLENQKRIDDLTKGKSEKGKNEKGKSEKGLIAESLIGMKNLCHRG